MDWQRELVAIPAPPFGEHARSEWMAARFNEAGLSEIEADAVGNVIGVIPATGLPRKAAARWWFSPRIWTPFSPLARLSTRSYCLKTTQSVLIAPGACDNTAGVVGILGAAKSRHGARGMEIVAASFANEHGQYSWNVEMLQTATIRVLLRAQEEIPTPSAGLHLFDRMNNLVFAAGTRQLRASLGPLRCNEERIVTFRLSMAVQPGPYTFNLGCSEASLNGPNSGYNHDRHEGLGPIEVHYHSEDTWPFYGVAQLPLEVEVLD